MIQRIQRVPSRQSLGLPRRDFVHGVHPFLAQAALDLVHARPRGEAAGPAREPPAAQDLQHCTEVARRFEVLPVGCDRSFAEARLQPRLRESERQVSPAHDPMP